MHNKPLYILCAYIYIYIYIYIHIYIHIYIALLLRFILLLQTGAIPQRPYQKQNVVRILGRTYSKKVLYSRLYQTNE